MTTAKIAKAIDEDTDGDQAPTADSVAVVLKRFPHGFAVVGSGRPKSWGMT